MPNDPNTKRPDLDRAQELEPVAPRTPPHRLHVDLAIDALRAAAQHVEALSAELEVRCRLGGLPAAQALIVDLVGITRHPPRYHLGHLSALDFERVCERLGAASVLTVHPDGARYLLLQVERDGLIIQAQGIPHQRRR